MGKLIRNGIEYGGGNGTDIFEVTQAQYDALVQAGTLVHNALYVITDAPNLNPTASDIEYSGAVTVKDKLDDLSVNVNGESYKTLDSADMTFDSGLSLHQTNQVYRIGRWCLLTISVKINRSVSGNCYITNYLPSGYLPYLKFTTAVENGLGDGKVTPIELQTDGKLRIYPTSLNTNIYAIGTVIYPLAEQ